MTIRRYATAAAFRQALEQRLRTSASSGPAFARRRQLLVFDRFLARVVDVLGDAVTLKGGLVLELRLERARTTKDVDLRVVGSPEDILATLRSAARRDMGDFMVFEVKPDGRHPNIDGDGMRYEGLRFRASCGLAGREYGAPFGVDVAFGDPILGAPPEVLADDLLGFAGVPPPKIRIYPIETHIAEKLHAYTMPRSRPNSRVRDLPDLALLASAETIRAERLSQALDLTFTFRDTHTLPDKLPAPPAAWAPPYEAMARADQLKWPDLENVAAAAGAFLDPVLGGRVEGSWEPSEWRWRTL